MVYKNTRNKSVRICVLLLLGLLVSNNVPADITQAVKLKVYGNWCGPEHPKVMEGAADPIDQLDAACKTHDYCYAEKGQLNCDCDKALDDELKQRLLADEFTGEQKHYARTLHHYFAGSPCDGTAEGKIAPVKMLHRIYNKTKDSVMSVYRVFRPAPADPQNSVTDGVENSTSVETAKAVGVENPTADRTAPQ